jgi:hypothetical protein
MPLLKYLFGSHERDRLPRLKNHLTSLEARREAADIDIQLLMMRGNFRDSRKAREFLEQHAATSFEDVEEFLPEPPPPDWRGRLYRWLALLEGAYTSNPHLTEDKETLKLYTSWWKNV